MKNETLKKRPIIISAWICAGKTYLTNKYDIILIAPCMPFEEMRNYGIDFVMAYPSPSCKEDYKQRARNRGANEEFVKRVETKIEPDYEEFLNQPNEKIIIEPGEYLEDALIRVGILEHNVN